MQALGETEGSAESGRGGRTGPGAGWRRALALQRSGSLRGDEVRCFGERRHYWADVARTGLLPYHRAAKKFQSKLESALKGIPRRVPIEIWFQDEMRIGQKNGCVRQWAKRGTRPRRRSTL